MRKNTVLAAAITTALSINVVYAGNFANWPTTCTATPCGAASGIAFDDDNDTTNAARNVVFASNVVKSTEKGINFGTHLFGSSAVILPSGTSDYFAAKYTLVGEVDFPFEFKATLSNGAQFNGTTTLEFLSKTNNNTTIQSGPTLTSNCDSKSVCQWSISPSSATLKDGDMFFVFYKIKNAQVLANAGEKITLSAQLGTTFTPALIDTREVSVAAGAAPLGVTFEAGTDTGIRISVAAQNTEFSSKTTGSSEFTSPQAVTMGYLKMAHEGDTTNPIVASDGSTRWSLGNTDTTAGGAAVFGAGFDSTNKIDTSLTISGGQFAASVKGTTGKVYLDIDTAKCASITPTSTQIEADLVDETNATWELTNTELKDITSVSSPTVLGGCNSKIPIVIKTDGTTSVNTVENAPTGSLTLDYAETNSLHDLLFGPTELSKFKADGTVCWVYNVPKSTATDTLALRITNDSSSAGTVNGTLYGQDGTKIFPADGSPPLNLLGDGVELAPGETKAIFSTTLEGLEGGPYTWVQRGALQITSTLSRLEVLTLLRSSTGTLTNLSTGDRKSVV